MDVLKALEAIRRKYLLRMDDDDWITINGTHVSVDKSGIITKGPSALKDAKQGSVKMKATKDDPFNDPKTGKFDPYRALMWMADHPEECERPKESKEEPVKRVPPPSRLPEKQINACRDAESGIIKQKSEKLVIVGKDGEVVLEESGNAGSVEFSQKALRAMENRVVTHNHPQDYGGTFSQNDIEVFAASGCKALRAVAKEGVYHLERGDADYTAVFQFKKEAKAASAMVMMELAGAKKLLENDVRDGRITRAEAQEKQKEFRKDSLKDLNRRYEEIADKHGLIYSFTSR